MLLYSDLTPGVCFHEGTLVSGVVLLNLSELLYLI